MLLYLISASYIKQCKRDDPKLSECMLRHGIEAIPTLVNGKWIIYFMVSVDTLALL